MKNNTLFWAIVVIMILAIIFIFMQKGNNSEEETIQCIAQNSKLFVSKICGHCAQQKAILGDYLELFDIVDCIDQSQECVDAAIEYVPTWIINEEKHVGVKEIDELKSLTGC